MVVFWTTLDTYVDDYNLNYFRLHIHTSCLDDFFLKIGFFFLMCENYFRLILYLVNIIFKL